MIQGVLPNRSSIAFFAYSGFWSNSERVCRPTFFGRCITMGMMKSLAGFSRKGGLLCLQPKSPNAFSPTN